MPRPRGTPHARPIRRRRPRPHAASSPSPYSNRMREIFAGRSGALLRRLARRGTDARRRAPRLPEAYSSLSPRRPSARTATYLEGCRKLANEADDPLSPACARELLEAHRQGPNESHDAEEAEAPDPLAADRRAPARGPVEREPHGPGGQGARRKPHRGLERHGPAEIGGFGRVGDAGRADGRLGGDEDAVDKSQRQERGEGP